MEKKYWKSIEEKQSDYIAGKEIQDQSVTDVLTNESTKNPASRRDFLKWCGISFFSATVVAACENPVKKAIPYVQQPEELIPGKASWYASTYSKGNHYCSVLVKSRDGRPIKIEGNEMSAFSAGGTTAQVQSSVLNLYDDGARYKSAMKNGKQITWEKADEEIIQLLKQANADEKKVTLVTPTLLSPSTLNLINDFQNKYNNVEHIQWDAISYESIRKAHQDTFGQSVIPDYRFDKASIIVSFSADFLATWMAPATFAKRYSETRRVSESDPSMSKHIHFEGNMSVTGANADERIPVKPTDEIKIIMALYNEMAAMAGFPVISSPSVDYDTRALAQQILDNKEKSLVVCGHNNEYVQMLINGINEMAASYGNTLDTNRSLNMGMGNHQSLNNLIRSLEEGQTAGVLFHECNPLYNHPKASKLKKALEKATFTVSFAGQKDETAEACQYNLPDHHYLESWNDASPCKGEFSLAQPAIHPLFKTRQFQSTLLTWNETNNNFYAYLKNYWQENMYNASGFTGDFERFWTDTLQKGVLELETDPAALDSFNSNSIENAFARLKSNSTNNTDTEYIVYEDVSMGDGSHAHNPWLQELPDPVTKVSWDNFAAISPSYARENNIKDGDILKINNLEIPALIQPGHASGCISMALGYGRTQAGKGGENIGINVFPLLDGAKLTGALKSVENTGIRHEFARSQTHHSMEGRAIVRESTLDQYRKNPKAGNEIRDYHKKYKSTLYPELDFPGPHWVLMVDLNACTGCSNCVVACQAENNVPVVGKQEVINRRIMHWMRIDRYYTGDADNPGVVFQPLMCQHCDHAPCENVCPVTATNHSQQGINQIAYNRCIGTKYCINNCPYKVRRFNWFRYAQNNQFDYNMNSGLGRMVLNPDVTVRERGVVEKCSFCIQRIQEGKLKAKNENRALNENDIVPACASSCPSNAIVFGDVNDKNSRVAQLIKDPRNYHLLEELHTLPSVGYLTKIRNA